MLPYLQECLPSMKNLSIFFLALASVSAILGALCAAISDSDADVEGDYARQQAAAARPPLASLDEGRAGATTGAPAPRRP